MGGLTKVEHARRVLLNVLAVRQTLGLGAYPLDKLVALVQPVLSWDQVDAQLRTWKAEGLVECDQAADDDWYTITGLGHAALARFGGQG